MLEHKAAGSQIRRPAEKQDVLPKDLTLYPSIRELVISFDGNCSVSIWRLVFDPFPSSRVFHHHLSDSKHRFSSSAPAAAQHTLGTWAPVPVLALALLTLMLLAGKDPCSLPNPATVNPEVLLVPTR